MKWYAQIRVAVFTLMYSIFRKFAMLAFAMSLRLPEFTIPTPRECPPILLAVDDSGKCFTSKFIMYVGLQWERVDNQGAGVTLSDLVDDFGISKFTLIIMRDGVLQTVIVDTSTRTIVVDGVSRRMLFRYLPLAAL